MLYLNLSIGTFTPSPYLDVHGEVDLSMRYFCFITFYFILMLKLFYNSRRGPRQFLHHARWEVIRKTWLSHGIPSMAARKLESSLDSGGSTKRNVGFFIEDIRLCFHCSDLRGKFIFCYY